MSGRAFCSKCAVYVEAEGPCPTCGEATMAVGELGAGPALSSGMRPPASTPASDRLVRSEFHAEAELDGGKQGTLSAPFSVVLASDGTLLVMDGGTSAMRIVRLAADGRLLKVVASIPSPGLELSSPHGVALGPDGRLYIPDAGADRIVVLSPDGKPMGQIAPERGSPHAFSFPKDVDLDEHGRMYVADSFNNRILRMDESGKFDLVLGVGADLDDDGYLDAGTRPGEFDEPAGVTADGEGRIYVADTNNHRLQVFHRDGSLLFAIGEEGDGLGQFRFPSDVRVGASGSVYVADRGNTRIQQFSPRGDLEAYFSLGADDSGIDRAVGDVDVGPDGEVYVPLPERNLVVRGRIGRAGGA